MKKIKLARYGGLSPVKQTHYTTNFEEMSYHGAPEKYGIYAFLHPYIDWFLLSGDTGKIKKYKEGQKFKNKHSKLNVPYRIFSVEGYIWTHIKPAPKYMNLVKEIRGSWFKIHSSDFPIVFKKEFSRMTGKTAESYTHDNENNRINKLSLTIKSPYKYICTDYLEIFIPKITKIKSI